MEKIFREFIVDKIGKFLNTHDFKPHKKIKFGSGRSGSVAWSWAPCDKLVCYVALEFFQKNQMAVVGIGWSSQKREIFDAVSTHESTVKALEDGGDKIGAILDRPVAYLHRTELGGADAFFGPVDELANIERAKVFYSNPLLLEEVNASLGYSKIDWEKNKLIRDWGVMSAYGELTKEDAEAATSIFLTETMDYLSDIGIPFLRDMSNSVCK